MDSSPKTSGREPLEPQRPNEPFELYETNQLHDLDEFHVLHRTQTSAKAAAQLDELPAVESEEMCGQMDFKQGGIDTNAKVANDGRVNINIKEQSRRLSKILYPAFVTQDNRPPSTPASLADADLGIPVPRMNIVIQIVGSRGDVQPFVALGQELKNAYGHRVRIATHPTFKKFVEENGLEFFSIGGDPAELMAFMVKNPGLMPGFDAMVNGDIGKRRKEIAEIISGCWRSCYEAGDGTGVPITDSNFDATQLEGAKPFVADAIIANPPSFAHIHCAEKLGIPLHLMFTMPWSPTQAFHHPLANIQFSNAEAGVANFVSYALVEMLTWQGLGDIINRFRERSLGLDPMNLIWAPGVLPRLRISYTYCWSPSLIPKPKDWAQHIDIAGFFFLPLASTYTPPNDLAAFLAAGPPPVYIGFGSIVLDDPNAMTELIFEAIKKTGQRALVSKGWGGFGAEEFEVPENVFMIGNCPHDWLFKRVSLVVHHGGAGTTAAGIALGKPTVVVPFFGDQPFWGLMVAKAGAGPKPIHHKELTADNLAAAITAALEPEAKRKAEELGAKIGHEKGVQNGAKSFHKQLKVDSVRCMIVRSRPAVWTVKHTNIRLSSVAVTTLASEGILDLADLKLYRPREYHTEPGPRDPITGGASALMGTLGDFTMGIADVPTEILMAITGSACRAHAKRKSKYASNSRKGSLQHSLTETSSAPSRASTTTPSETEIASESSTPIVSGEDNSDNTTERTSSSSLERDDSTLRSAKSKPSERRNITSTDVVCAGQAARRIINLGLKSPMDFALGVSKGFHNAPKLYGDTTVRDTPKVTGFHSGLKAAGKELGYGFYDGISGLVTQPLAGVKDGASGLVKGFGKGIGGLILKPGAGIFALTGYTMSGVYKEIQKRLGTSIEHYIIASRSIEGYEEWKNAPKSERTSILREWYSLSTNPEVKVRGSTFGSELEALSRGIFDHARISSEVKRQRSRADSPARAESPPPEGLFNIFRTSRVKSSCPFHHSHHQHHDPQHRDVCPSLASEIEKAIHKSVEKSSSANAEEARLIERALRASISELQMAEADGESEEEAYARAIKASIEEAQRTQQEHRLPGAHPHTPLERRHLVATGDDSAAPPAYSIRMDRDEHGYDDGDEDAELERTLAESIRSHNEEQQRDKEELDVLTEYMLWKSMRDSSASKQVLDSQPEQQTNSEDLREGLNESLNIEGNDIKHA
ncbi:hypothetical protein AJ78_04775 [Emergomyces pasteurianus Ep9510]|uniref:Uncharacterized protein n=1 Tax=Emergomyces pasteurianus Ep9510 TaxID=1447872 RepID=A0A1J9QG74_9EURO|nr:hypothetical protein AJ78_04775 [Emergomyces pasteurianus Ep9510]